MNENKFDGKSILYDKYRPSYPKSIIEIIFEVTNINENSVIVDIGAGTGIFTELLLDKKNKVYGVEPNRNMRVVAEKKFNQYSNFVSLDALAENTGLPDNCCDLITVAQAFHWFDKSSFKEECRRLLNKKGKVALIWNSLDAEANLSKELYNINKKYCPDFKGYSDGYDFKEIERFFEGDFITIENLNPILCTEEKFIGRHLSSSYSLKENSMYYNDYKDELKNLFAKYADNGELLTEYITQCYIGSIK